MTIKWLSLIVSLTLIATILSAPSRVLAAPKLYFDPTTVTIKKDQEFIVPVKIDVESAQTIGTDITINYAGEDQEVISVDNTYFFSEFNSANTTIGKLEIHAFSSSIHQAKTGSGTVANIKFKAKRDNGSSAITFNCNGTGDDTNILSSTGNNILNCNSLNQALMIYSSNSDNLETSPSPSPSRSPSPSSSGSTPSPIAPTCTSLTLDPISSDKIPQAVTLACQGKDSDSDILSGELVFGDGTSQKITRNLGRSGSISTTHTYTKAGSYKATCKLSDGALSSASCVKTLTIKLKATPTPTPKPKASVTPTLTSLVLESPSPLPAPSTSPKETQTATPKSIWWILPLIVILIGVILTVYFVKMLPRAQPPETYA